MHASEKMKKTRQRAGVVSSFIESLRESKNQTGRSVFLQDFGTSVLSDDPVSPSAKIQKNGRMAKSATNVHSSFIAQLGIVSYNSQAFQGKGAQTARVLSSFKDLETVRDFVPSFTNLEI